MCLVMVGFCLGLSEQSSGQRWVGKVSLQERILSLSCVDTGERVRGNRVPGTDLVCVLWSYGGAQFNTHCGERERTLQ